MKITRRQLKRIIKEELQQVMMEQELDVGSSEEELFRPPGDIERQAGEEAASALSHSPAGRGTTGSTEAERAGRAQPLRGERYLASRAAQHPQSGQLPPQTPEQAKVVQSMLPHMARTTSRIRTGLPYRTGPPPTRPEGGQLPQVTRESLLNDITEAVLAKLMKQ